jgi:sugar/nucleoside kinase (ribokinase family)
MVMATLDGEPTGKFLADVRKAGVKTLLDTVYLDSAAPAAWHAAIDPALPALDYFIPSYPEARALTGQSEPSEIARKLQAGGCANVIIKMDERGAFCREASGRETFVPAYVVEKVVDTTGAGDCWSAGFLAGLREGLSVPEAVKLGNATAAHCIQAPGASTGIVALEQIKDFQKRTPLRG